MIGPAYGGSVIGASGAAEVMLQDQTTPALDLYFSQGLGAPTTSTADVAVDDRTMTVASVASLSIGDFTAVISRGDTGPRRFYFAEITNIVGNTLTFDTPFDFAFSTGAFVQGSTRELNVNGSVTPQFFTVRPGGTASFVAVDITRIMISMVCDTGVDLTKFGDIAGGLTNGIVLRRKDGTYNNIWNIKTNQEIGTIAYDLELYAGTNPVQGVDGLLARYTLAGQEKHGVTIRLNPGDELQLIVQDDLSSLLSFRMVAEGHIVTQ